VVVAEEARGAEALGGVGHHRAFGGADRGTQLVGLAPGAHDQAGVVGLFGDPFPGGVGQLGCGAEMEGERQALGLNGQAVGGVLAGPGRDLLDHR